MSRLSRKRTSRTVVSITVLAIALGAVLQFHHLRRSGGTAPPPAAMSVGTPGPTPAVMKPSPAVQLAPVKPVPSPIQPMVSQTPDPTKPNQAGNQLVQAGQQQPPVKLNAQAPSPAPAAQTTAAASAQLADAQTKYAAGDLLAARTMDNNALLSNKLNAADMETVKKQLTEINQTLVFSPKQFPSDPLGGIYTVKSGDRLAAIGTANNIPFELLLPLNRMTDGKQLRFGQQLKIIKGPFHAVVTKSKFTLDIYLGSAGGSDSTYITTFGVGLGTDNSTPTGTWTIKNKVKHPAYFPPAEHPGPTLLPDDPKNPLGPYWLGLEGTDGHAVGQRSYGIHGTIDPSSIGKQSSMGCIRLKNEDVETVYKLLIAGKSTVVVRD